MSGGPPRETGRCSALSPGSGAGGARGWRWRRSRSRQPVSTPTAGVPRAGRRLRSAPLCSGSRPGGGRARSPRSPRPGAERSGAQGAGCWRGSGAPGRLVRSAALARYIMCGTDVPRAVPLHYRIRSRGGRGPGSCSAARRSSAARTRLQGQPVRSCWKDTGKGKGRKNSFFSYTGFIYCLLSVPTITQWLSVLGI